MTETDGTAAALAEARERWPEDRSRPARLLQHLVEEGRRRLSEQKAIRVKARRAAVAATSGALTGAYGESYLDRLGEDWP